LAKNQEFLMGIVNESMDDLKLNTGSRRQDAVALTYDFSNKILLFFQAVKRLVSVGIFGFQSLMQRLVDDAKANARNYQSESLENSTPVRPGAKCKC